jgi:hypothetical protein
MSGTILIKKKNKVKTWTYFRCSLKNQIKKCLTNTNLRYCNSHDLLKRSRDRNQFHHLLKDYPILVQKKKNYPIL